MCRHPFARPIYFAHVSACTDNDDDDGAAWRHRQYHWRILSALLAGWSATRPWAKCSKWHCLQRLWSRVQTHTIRKHESRERPDIKWMKMLHEMFKHLSIRVRRNGIPNTVVAFVFFSKLDCGNIIPNVVIEHQIEVSCDQRIAHVHATRARAQPLCLHVLCVLYVYECGLTWQKLSSGRQCGISRSIRRVRQKPEKKWTRQPRKSGICHFFCGYRCCSVM